MNRSRTQHLLMGTEHLGRAGLPRAEAESTVVLARMEEAAGLIHNQGRWSGESVFRLLANSRCMVGRKALCAKGGLNFRKLWREP